MLALMKTAVAVALAAAVAVSGIPTAAPDGRLEVRDGAGGGYWMETIKRQGSPAFGTPGYKLFRNVKDYGAKG